MVPSVLPLLAVSPIVLGVLIVIFLAICMLLVLTVLIQKPQGGGLSAAFGASSGSGQTAFGTKTGDALTIFTIIIFSLYLVSAVALNKAARPSAEPDVTDKAATSGEPATGETPAAPAPNDGQPASPPASTPATTPGTSPVSDPSQAPAPTTVPPATVTPTPGQSTPPAPVPAPAPTNPQPAPETVPPK
jgi:protein translocase SecG subunit